MANNYHVNPATGRVGKCEAEPGKCPHGENTAHGDTKQEAREAYEAKQTSDGRNITGISRNKFSISERTIYRNGSLVPAQYEGEVKEMAERADSERPEGYPPRHGSIYASPSLNGTLRWIDNNNAETNSFEVDPERVFVFKIKEWENYSWSMDAEKSSKEYWDSGITLAEYRKGDYNDDEWELLIDHNQIKNVKSISKTKIINQAKKSDFSNAENLIIRLKRSK